jgi:hypothetical protein
VSIRKPILRAGPAVHATEWRKWLEDITEPLR